MTVKTGLREKGVHQHLPMSSPAAAAQNSSFAAALRKLAKQAMSPGSTVPPTNNQTLSPVKGIQLSCYMTTMLYRLCEAII